MPTRDILVGLLAEWFPSFRLLAFDTDGEAYEITHAECEKDLYALLEWTRRSLASKCAPRPVDVRFMPPEEPEQWQEVPE